MIDGNNAGGTGLGMISQPSQQPQVSQSLDRLRQLVRDSATIAELVSAKLNQIAGAPPQPESGAGADKPAQRPGLIGAIEDICDNLSDANDRARNSIQGISVIL